LEASEPPSRNWGIGHRRPSGGEILIAGQASQIADLERTRDEDRGEEKWDGGHHEAGYDLPK